jgi:hypothetical protein
MWQEVMVGEPYLPIIGKPEGVYFESHSDGLELIYNFPRPTTRELEQTAADQAFEIRATELRDVIIITTKFGSLPWADAPYNPQLTGAFHLHEINDNSIGYTLLFYLTDAQNGILKGQRLIGLGHNFSVKFREMVVGNLDKGLSKSEFDKNLEYVYANYDKKQIADYASLLMPVYCPYVYGKYECAADMEQCRASAISRGVMPLLCIRNISLHVSLLYMPIVISVLRTFCQPTPISAAILRNGCPLAAISTNRLLSNISILPIAIHYIMGVR